MYAIAEVAEIALCPRLQYSMAEMTKFMYCTILLTRQMIILFIG